MQTTELSDDDRETLGWIAAAEEADAIDRALTAARERLRMDAAYVSQLDSRRQLIEEVSGDSEALGFKRGTEIPIEDTYCTRMLKGELPNIVPDTSREPLVQGLPTTEWVGSYVGVAVRLHDGTVHGTLCCASAEPCELGEAELAFVRVLSGMVAARIDRAHGRGPL